MLIDLLCTIFSGGAIFWITKVTTLNEPLAWTFAGLTGVVLGVASAHAHRRQDANQENKQ